MGGVLAIDLGARKTGFASADALRISLQPLDSVRAEGEALLAHVARLLEERDVTKLLVGLPLHMSGEESERSEASRQFAESLRERFPGVTVSLYDERLTTKEAEGRLREQGFRGRRIAAHKDSWSALVLLEDWVQAGEPD